MNNKDEKWFKSLDFDWCPVGEQARLGELLIMHGSSEHLVFFTTEGYDSDKERESLGHEDCMYIHTWKTQRRVVAKHFFRGFFSIPAEYPIKFKELPDGPTDTLKNLVLRSENGLPMQVQVATKEANVFYDMSGGRVDIPMQELEIVHMYEDTFAVGNLLLDGSIQPQLAVVPIYLPTRGVVARGLKNHPREVWLALLDHYKTFVRTRNVNTDLLMDNKEINMYSHQLLPEDFGEYATLKPDTYIKFDMSCLPPVSDTPPPRPPRPKGLGKSEKPSHFQKLRGLINSSNKTETLPKSTINITKKKISDRPLPPIPKDDDMYCDPVSDDGTDDSGDKYDYEYVKKDAWGVHTGFSGHSLKSPKDAVKKPTVSTKPAIVREEQGTMKCIVRPMQLGTNSNAKNENETRALPAIPGGQTAFENRTNRGIPVLPRTGEWNNKEKLKPRDVRPCFAVKASTRNHDPKAKSRDHTSKSEIASMDDVPDDLSQLSVDEVADCLRLLNLSKYIKPFNANQVDGGLLVTLDVDTLVEGFEMPRFEAVKLERFFTRKWRPKLE